MPGPNRACHPSEIGSAPRITQSVEIASKSYNAHTIQNWYTVYDFAEDAELRRVAGAFLDLYWATWAEEQIDSVRGGGKTRIYQGPASRTGAGGAVETMVDLYLDRRDDTKVSSTDWVVITSGYRLPELVVGLAQEVEARGSYEVTQRCMGLQEPGLGADTNPPASWVKISPDSQRGPPTTTSCSPRSPPRVGAIDMGW